MSEPIHDSERDLQCHDARSSEATIEPADARPIRPENASSNYIITINKALLGGTDTKEAKIKIDADGNLVITLVTNPGFHAIETHDPAPGKPIEGSTVSLKLDLEKT